MPYCRSMFSLWIIAEQPWPDASARCEWCPFIARRLTAKFYYWRSFDWDNWWQELVRFRSGSVDIPAVHKAPVSSIIRTYKNRESLRDDSQCANLKMPARALFISCGFICEIEMQIMFSECEPARQNIQFTWILWTERAGEDEKKKHVWGCANLTKTTTCLNLTW